QQVQLRRLHRGLVNDGHAVILSPRQPTALAGWITPSRAAERMAGGGRHELANAPRAEDPHGRAEGEVVLRRHDAGEGAEESVGLLLVSSDSGQEVALYGSGRGKGGEAEGEVVDAADGPVAAALMVVQRVGQRPAA